MQLLYMPCKQLCIYFFILLNSCFVSVNAEGQNISMNRYGLHIIHSAKELQQTIRLNANNRMVDITKVLPGIVLDLKYAGTDNFMKQKLYPSIQTTYLRAPAAAALQKVIAELKEKNLTLKIWDAYRPYSVTEAMWEPVKDDRYAADPKFGSGHNRGIAVDLTLIDITTRKELDMGTGFDNFSDSAHHDFRTLPAHVLANRLLLRTVMEKYGFTTLESEWWHYYLPDAKQYELMDVSFKTLRKLSAK